MAHPHNRTRTPRIARFMRELEGEHSRPKVNRSGSMPLHRHDEHRPSPSPPLLFAVAAILGAVFVVLTTWRLLAGGVA